MFVTYEPGHIVGRNTPPKEGCFIFSSVCSPSNGCGVTYSASTGCSGVKPSSKRSRPDGPQSPPPPPLLLLLLPALLSPPPSTARGGGGGTGGGALLATPADLGAACRGLAVRKSLRKASLSSMSPPSALGQSRIRRRSSSSSSGSGSSSSSSSTRWARGKA